MDEGWERLYWQQGYRFVAGIDEVGRGPLAGPVLAAAVVLRPDGWPDGLDDSKRLSAARRLRLFRELRRTAVAWSVGMASPVEIDRWNIRMASFMAMERALARLRVQADAALVDGFRIPGLPLPQEGIVDGDARVPSIAAASIMAKVVRDRLMDAYSRLFPGYGFEAHKGYATAAHRRALRRLGPSPIHRRSFAPVRALEERREGGREQPPPGQRRHPLRGLQAERWAAAALRSCGYRLLERNRRLRRAEADIIALESGHLVIVEVRYRSSALAGTPAETLDRRKLQRLRGFAAAYLDELRRKRPELARTLEGVRFDVVEVFPGLEGPRMRLLQDAF